MGVDRVSGAEPSSHHHQNPHLAPEATLHVPGRWQVFLGMAILAAVIQLIAPGAMWLTPAVGFLGFGAVSVGTSRRRASAFASSGPVWRDPWALIAVGLVPVVLN